MCCRCVCSRSYCSYCAACRRRACSRCCASSASGWRAGEVGTVVDWAARRDVWPRCDLGGTAGGTSSAGGAGAATSAGGSGKRALPWYDFSSCSRLSRLVSIGSDSDRRYESDGSSSLLKRASAGCDSCFSQSASRDEAPAAGASSSGTSSGTSLGASGALAGSGELPASRHTKAGTNWRRFFKNAWNSSCDGPSTLCSRDRSQSGESQRTPLPAKSSLGRGGSFMPGVSGSGVSEGISSSDTPNVDARCTARP